MKVMICDNNMEKVKVIKDLLNVYNLKFIMAKDDVPFFKQVEIHKPGILILNDSFSVQTLKELRSHPITRNIPVILISDKDKRNNRISETDSLTALFSEPFKIKNLRHVIDRWTTFRSLYIKQ